MSGHIAADTEFHPLRGGGQQHPQKPRGRGWELQPRSVGLVLSCVKKSGFGCSSLGWEGGERGNVASWSHLRPSSPRSEAPNLVPRKDLGAFGRNHTRRSNPWSLQKRTRSPTCTDFIKAEYQMSSLYISTWSTWNRFPGQKPSSTHRRNEAIRAVPHQPSPAARRGWKFGDQRCT